MSASISVIGNVQLDVLASPVTAMPSPGGDTVIDRIAVRTAGAAGNVSLALAALGARHRLFGAVGDDDAGRWVASELRRLGLGEDLLVVEGQMTGISIAVEAPGRERAFLTAHGVLTDYDISRIPSGAVSADLVLLTGYFSLPALRGGGTCQLLQRARSAGARTFFDTGWDPEEWRGGAAQEVLDVLPLVDVFLPNEPEALALTGEQTATRGPECPLPELSRVGRAQARTARRARCRTGRPAPRDRGSGRAGGRHDRSRRQPGRGADGGAGRRSGHGDCAAHGGARRLHRRRTCLAAPLSQPEGAPARLTGRVVVARTAGDRTWAGSQRCVAGQITPSRA